MLTAGRVASVFVVVAGALSVISMQYALIGQPAQDFAVDPLRREVAWVLPGGSTWDAGIRPGQRLLELSHVASPHDWRLQVVAASGGTFSATASAHLNVLRGSALAGVAAAVMSLLALLLLSRHRGLGGAVSLVAMALATLPIAAMNEPVMSTGVMSTAPLAGALWLGLGPSYAAKRAMLVLVVAVTAAWFVTRVWLPDVFPLADSVRNAATVGVVLVAVAVAAPWRAWFVRTATHDPPRMVDVAAVAVILAGAVGEILIANLPMWLVAISAVALVLLYQVVRRPLGAALEDLLLGGIRERTAIAATEEERARLAGEIHDGPLQTLAAAIAELDEQGRTVSAVELMREAGAELRAVSAALRPPVLDDLGLASGIAWLVEQTRIRADADVVIKSEVQDGTGISRGARPPAEVELAVFRIVQEAIGNALLHAHASEIAVNGSISDSDLVLEVRDDGRGIDDAHVRDARRAGRLGLPTMRKRASTIGADLSVDTSPNAGTRIRLRWRLG